MEPESFRIGPFEPSLPEPGGNGASNGHRRAPKARRAASQVWPVAAGALLAAVVALGVVPRLHFLNLALFNPWQRPVIAAALGGLAAGLIRGRRAGSHGGTHAGSGGGRRAYAAAALSGALAGIIGLWLAALAVRAQVRVLFVDRNPARVIAADLLRLAAYAVVPAAGCAVAGAFGRAASAARRRPSPGASGKRRDETPITEL